MQKSLDGRIALITGASRGIGRALAVAFAQQGAHVIALGRTQSALQDLDEDIQEVGGAATLVRTDLREIESLDHLGPALLERWGKLDVFCGNAAILGPTCPLADVAAKEWDDVMRVNVTANFRLLRILDPLLQLSDSGRVILMSSAAAWKRRPHLGPYSVSKAALEALGHAYAREVASTPIKVMMVDPGPSRTDMRATAVPDEDPMAVTEPAGLVPHIVEIAATSWTHTGKIFDLSGATPRLCDFGVPTECNAEID